MSIRAWLVRRKIRSTFRPKELESAPAAARLKHFSAALKFSESRIPGPPKVANIEKVDQEGVKGEWVSMPGAQENRILLYCHGGGYVWGGPKPYRNLGAHLSKAMKAKVFLLDYRLAPAHKCPAPIEDALAAYDWITKTNKKATITMAGDSAGGGLTLATAQAIRDSGRVMPKALALISPWLDITGKSGSLKTNRDKEIMLDADGIAVAGDVYRGELPADDPRCSPLFGDQANIPPVIVHVGSEEILLDDARKFTAVAREAGVIVELDIWKKMHHVWHMSADIVPEGKRAIADIGAFFETHWGC